MLGARAQDHAYTRTYVQASQMQQYTNAPCAGCAKVPQTQCSGLPAGRASVQCVPAAHPQALTLTQPSSQWARCAASSTTASCRQALLCYAMLAHPYAFHAGLQRCETASAWRQQSHRMHAEQLLQAPRQICMQGYPPTQYRTARAGASASARVPVCKLCMHYAQRQTSHRTTGSSNSRRQCNLNQQ